MLLLEELFIVNIEGEQARLRPFNSRSRNMTLTKSDCIASNAMDMEYIILKQKCVYIVHHQKAVGGIKLSLRQDII